MAGSKSRLLDPETMRTCTKVPSRGLYKLMCHRSTLENSGSHCSHNRKTYQSVATAGEASFRLDQCGECRRDLERPDPSRFRDVYALCAVQYILCLLFVNPTLFLFLFVVYVHVRACFFRLHLGTLICTSASVCITIFLLSLSSPFLYCLTFSEQNLLAVALDCTETTCIVTGFNCFFHFIQVN